MVRLGAATLLAVVALPLPLPLPLLAQTEQRSLKGPRVAIYNLAGRMRAVAGTGDAVTVAITRNGPDAQQLRVESGDIRGREALRVIYPADRVVYRDLRSRRATISVRSDGTFSDGSWDELTRGERVDIRSTGPGLDAHADLTVAIPKGRTVELFLAVGRVDVTNVEGDIYVDVASADVEVSGVKGALTLDTGSGHISARDVTGDLNLDSGSGGVSLSGVKGGSLRLDSGSGGIQGTDIDVRELVADVGSGGLRMYRTKAVDISVETGSGGATLELLSDVERLSVETGSGGVTIRAPANLGAEVEVETGSGGFQTDFEITTQRLGRNHVQGRIGDGRGRIRVEAGSGTIRLLKN